MESSGAVDWGAVVYYSAKSLTGPAETQNASRRLLGGWVMDSNGQSEPRLCKSGDRSANGAAWVICPEAFHREIEPSDRQNQARGIGGLPTFSVITSNIYETGEDLCCLLFVVFKRACQSVSGPPPHVLFVTQGSTCAPTRPLATQPSASGPYSTRPPKAGLSLFVARALAKCNRADLSR